MKIFRKKTKAESILLALKIAGHHGGVEGFLEAGGMTAGGTFFFTEGLAKANKGEASGMVIGGSRAKDKAGGKVVMIWRVGAVLGFEADGAMAVVGYGVFVVGEEVCHVDLEGGMIGVEIHAKFMGLADEGSLEGPHGHRSAGVRVGIGIGIGFMDEAVVEAVVDVADPSGSAPEVELSVFFDGSKVPSGDATIVGDDVPLAVGHPEEVVVDFLKEVPRKVPVDVIRDVDDRRFGLPVQMNDVPRHLEIFFLDAVPRRRPDPRSGEGRILVVEDELDDGTLLDRPFPDPMRPSPGATVEPVGPVVVRR